MEALAENLWVLRYPLRIACQDHKRIVTIIRLRNGQLILHSTAPFSLEDAASIRKMGDTGWIVDATLLHDTFARPAHACFPDWPYLAPQGFANLAGVPSQVILPSPDEWNGEVDVLEIKGIPKMREHVFFHRASRTLIAADLLFHFDSPGTAGTRFVRRWIMGLQSFPGMSRFFRFFIADRAAFELSVRAVAQWDFDRIIVGHDCIVETAGKERFRHALDLAGFSL